MHPFSPADDPRGFRNALGRFATGVTIVTTRGATGPVGITANSFSSLSLDPPLLLWSIARSSARCDSFTNAPHFAVHVLARHQAHIARAFATEADAFGDLDHSHSPRDVPLLDDCIARFECDREAVHDGGDHALIIGRVTEALTREGPALVFHDGQFGQVAP